ncbi:MAG: hypothetical protein ABIJ43_02770 [Candidatus Beckwithbacteria bacterium]|nr:hypothetical protein [Patescibacteria group bacterium]
MLLPLLSFTITTIILYLSSRSLTNNLLKLFFRITKSQPTSINLLFFLLLPGIFLHEFSHILIATILRVPTGRLSLKPEVRAPNFSKYSCDPEQSRGTSSEPKKFGSLTLGSAQIATTDPIRMTLIGTAPFIIGTIILWLILTVGFNLNLDTNLFSQISSLATLPTLTLFILSYLLFAISNTMFSSPSDLQSAGMPIILILIILGIFKLANLNIPQFIITYSINLFSLLTTIFISVFILNLLLIIPLKLIPRVTNFPKF